MRSKVKKAVGAALAVSAVSVLGMGALHMPFARPLLAMLGGGCPMGKATGVDVERERLLAVKLTRGAALSPSRPALGFVLDKTTVDAAVAWAKTRNLPCTVERERTLMLCDAVPANHVGEPEPGLVDLKLGFTPKGVLVNLTAVRRDLLPDDAERVLAGVVGRMATDLGTPTVAAGERTAAYLGGDLLRTATVEYHFSDYQAEVSATNMKNMPWGTGIIVREHYISARD